MKYETMVKVNGVYYPAGAEIPETTMGIEADTPPKEPETLPDEGEEILQEEISAPKSRRKKAGDSDGEAAAK